MIKDTPTPLDRPHAPPAVSLLVRLGVSVTLTWGRWGLPIPKPVKLVYARQLVESGANLTRALSNQLRALFHQTRALSLDAIAVG